MPVNVRIVDVTPENVESVPCCGLKDVQHEGRQRKVAWLKDYFDKGLKAKILMHGESSQIGYIEYLPGENALRAVEAKGYLFIHCLWTFYKKFQNRGRGGELIQCAVEDAKRQQFVGVATIARKKPWLAGSEIFLKNGFEAVDSHPPDYELLVKKLKPSAPDPKFIPKNEADLVKLGQGFTVIRSGQCPHTIRFSNKIIDAAQENYGLEPHLVELNTADEARKGPTPFAVFSIIHDDELVIDHHISRTRFENIMKKRGYD